MTESQSLLFQVCSLTRALLLFGPPGVSIPSFSGLQSNYAQLEDIRSFVSLNPFFFRSAV